MHDAVNARMINVEPANDGNEKELPAPCQGLSLIKKNSERVCETVNNVHVSSQINPAQRLKTERPCNS